MIVLAFTVCLFADPEFCEKKRLTFTERMTLFTCVMRAQPQLAKWAELHPKWRITRWRCEMAKDREINA